MRSAFLLASTIASGSKTLETVIQHINRLASPLRTLTARLSQILSNTSSRSSLLLAAGAKGMRFSLPNARVMVHQPSGGFRGQAADIMLHAQEILKLKQRLNEIYVKHTGQSLDAVEAALERDNFMTAETAKSFGIVDEVITDRATLGAGGEEGLRVRGGQRTRCEGGAGRRREPLGNPDLRGRRSASRPRRWPVHLRRHRW